MKFPHLSGQNSFNQRNLIRLGICWGVIVIGYLILESRLFYEQVLVSHTYEKSVTQQTVRRIRLPAQRGRILSQNGTLIADTLPSYSVVFHLTSMLKRQRKATVATVLTEANRISAAAGRQSSLTREEVERHMNLRPGLPVTILEDLSTEEMAALLEMPEAPSGMEVTVSSVRRYPLGRTAAHLLGWVGKSDPTKQEDRRKFNYYESDWVGRFGLENILDSVIPIDGTTERGLRGTAGEKLVLVNSRGYPVEELGASDDFRDGNSVRLTLDIHAQTLAERLMTLHCGAFVLLDVGRGDVLAMVSTPGYDLNECVPSLPTATYKNWLSDPEKPLIDRAANSMEMPGSIIKPLVALAIMKKYPASTPVFCDGISEVGIRCTGRHGAVDLAQALAKSCNVYFVERGIGTGLDQIQAVFAEAGIGSVPKGFLLPAVRGSLPSRELKERIDHSPWNAFDTALISIGQGKVAVSPLQAALYMSAIANGGTAYVPNLISEVLAPDGTILRKHEGRLPIIHLKGSPFEFGEIQRGMKRVCERGGTGVRANNNNAVMFGKSGTAEIGSVALGNRRKNTWFAGYAKHQNGRTYAFCTLIENGASGGGTNAPILSDFFNHWIPGGPSLPPLINRPTTL